MAVRVSPTFGFRAMVLSGILALSSCAGGDEGRLTVATNLPQSEIERIEKALGDPSIRVAWIRVPKWDDPASVLDRAGPIDVLLGATGDSFQTLEQQGRLEPLEGPSTWYVLRSEAVGRLVLKGNPAETTFGEVTLDDPRRSSVALSALRAKLDEDAWGASYRAVLSAAAHRPMIGSQAGDSVSRLLDGEVPVALGRADRVPDRCEFRAEVPPVYQQEGIGILRGTPHLEAARRLVTALVGPREEPAGSTRNRPPPPQILLPELLGAVLVDSQPELIEAFEALREAKLEHKAEEWLVPPPWPPASIAKLQRSDRSGALVESLAEQMVPDLKSRVWLLESWKRSPRPIDANLLRELTTAADGKLVAEPRFRAWLAVEWRTWARQCYRRVTREARRLGP